MNMYTKGQRLVRIRDAKNFTTGKVYEIELVLRGLVFIRDDNGELFNYTLPAIRKYYRPATRCIFDGATCTR